MEIIIKINGQAVSVEVTVEVYEYLNESDHKTENLSHQMRRYWDMREFDEYISPLNIPIYISLLPKKFCAAGKP